MEHGGVPESYKIMLMRLNLPLSGYVTSLKDTHIWAAAEGKIPRLLLMWCDKWLFIEIDIAWNIQMIGKPQDLRPENLWKIYAPSLESLSPGREKPEKRVTEKSRNKMHDLSA